MALKLELSNLRHAAEGTRNDTLNKAAFNLGQFVGGGYLDRARVESELSAAAAMIGLGESETAGTIRSGIEAGIKEPRTIQPRPIRTTSAPSEDESAAAPDAPEQRTHPHSRPAQR